MKQATHKQVTDNETAAKWLKDSSMCGVVRNGDKVTMTKDDVDCKACKRLLARKSAGGDA